jgi:hypothetical protein
MSTAGPAFQVEGGLDDLHIRVSFTVNANFFGTGMGAAGVFSPVILDLDDDGITIEQRPDSPVYFNLDADPYLEQTAWIGGGDGLLWIDLAADGSDAPNGRFDSNVKEIAFAGLTADPDDTDLEALAALYDDNGNGQLDPGDPYWGRFYVLNANGGFQTLSALGITSISLTSDQRASLLPDGSRIDGFGSFVRNGTTYALANAALSYELQGFIRSSEDQRQRREQRARRRRRRRRADRRSRERYAERRSRQRHLVDGQPRRSRGRGGRPGQRHGAQHGPGRHPCAGGERREPGPRFRQRGRPGQRAGQHDHRQRRRQPARRRRRS